MGAGRLAWSAWLPADIAREGWQAYLRGRRDTIRCIVAALTDDAQSGEPGAGESLFDELSRPADAEVPHRPRLAVLAPPAACLMRSKSGCS